MDCHRSNQQLPMNTGLTRYRSAPSSYFSSFLDAADEAIRSGGGGGGDDMDIFLNKYMPSNSIRSSQGQGSTSNNSFSGNMNLQSQSQFVASMKQERDAIQEDQNIYTPVSSLMHQNQAQVRIPAQVLVPAPSQSQPQPQMNAISASPMKLGIGGDNSNLIRYNSSPAGFFATLDMEHEYGALGGMANFGGGNSANAEASFPSASRFHPGLMPPIAEIGTSGMGETSPAGFPIRSWDDSSAVLTDSFLKLGDDHDDNKALSNIAEAPSRPPTILSHHLSLPKTSDELSAMETLMQDSVLCKLRAKRGCATHPRSIAERVRRTRISERMRKLQELVPNMDKQTNTSDMLDLAVDYIKDLKKQLQGLTDNRAKCTCLNN